MVGRIRNLIAMTIVRTATVLVQQFLLELKWGKGGKMIDDAITNNKLSLILLFT